VFPYRSRTGIWVCGSGQTRPDQQQPQAAAAAAISQAQGSMANQIANQKTQSVPVGTGGQLVSGTSPDGSKSVSVLYFTQGNAASTIEFSGPANDPAPSAAVIEMGQQQVAAIKSQLGG
jgi:hypothetical protein